MPYPAMLVPLTRFFATDAPSGFQPTALQRKQLIRWFWRSCFSRRYSSSVNRAHAADIAAMDSLKTNENADDQKFSMTISEDFFQDNTLKHWGGQHQDLHFTPRLNEPTHSSGECSSEA